MFTNRLKQASEQETRFVQDRILLAERNIAELNLAIGTYARKAARLRDVGDELSATLENYSKNETIEETLSEGLHKFATSLQTINSYGDKRVEYIESKVVDQLSTYESTCKTMKDNVKTIVVTKDREGMRQKKLDRIKERNPRNRQQIVEAESELVQAKAEVARTIHNLEDKLVTFERQKLHDIKEIFLDFIATELGYHSKALTLLTGAFNGIKDIDIDSDISDIQKVFDEFNPNFKSALHGSNNIRKKGGLSKNQLSHSMNTLALTSNRTGIPSNKDMKQSLKQKAQSEEVINQLDDSQSQSAISDTEYTNSETEDISTLGEDTGNK